MATQQEVIQNFMKSLDKTSLSGESAVDEAIQACSHFGSISDAISQMVSDCKNSSSATNFLTNYCGINLYNEDTGSITGSDAGGSTTKTAESIVPEVRSLATYSNNSFTSNGLTVELVSFSDTTDYSSHYTSTTYSSLTSSQKYIWNALYTWWIPCTLDLISESYGDNFGFTSISSATTKTLHAGFVDEDSNTLALVTDWSDGQTVVDLDLKTNMKYYDDVDTSDPNGSTSSTSYYLDRTLAHEMTHAVMAANIDYFRYLPFFIKEGMAELTHGIDDTRTARILSLAGDSDSLESALDVSATSGTNANPYAAGYMFLRYLAKQAAENADDTLTWRINGTTATYGTLSETLITLQGLKSGLTVSGGEISGITLENNVVTLSETVLGDDGASVSGSGYSFVLSGAGKLTNSGTATTLTGSSENDTLIGGKNADTLIGESGADYISGGYGDDSISGGNDADTLIGSYGADYVNGGYGDDSISGGNDADTLIGSYGADYVNGGYGNDSILGGSGNDSLLGSYGADYVNGGYGNDSILGGSGNDTLRGSYGADYVNGGYGNDSILGGSGADSLLGSYGADYINGGYGNDSILGGSGADTLRGSYGADYLSGGSGNDSLSGGNGADTLYGGSGNDTLTGGKNKDIFVYAKSTGDDVITDYTAGVDKIRISSGSISAVTVDDDDLIFTIGKGTLTIQNGGSKKITVINSKGNESTKIYSSSDNIFAETNENIADVWFAEEDSFLSTDSAQLDLITEESSIGEFEFSSPEKDIKRYDMTFAGE